MLRDFLLGLTILSKEICLSRMTYIWETSNYCCQYFPCISSKFSLHWYLIRYIPLDKRITLIEKHWKNFAFKHMHLQKLENFFYIRMCLLCWIGRFRDEKQTFMFWLKWEECFLSARETEHLVILFFLSGYFCWIASLWAICFL